MLVGMNKNDSKEIAKQNVADRYTTERCVEEKEQIIPGELNACAKEVDRYYSIKVLSDKGKSIDVGYILDGGDATRRSDSIAPPTGISDKPYSYERISEKAPFDVRDAMYTGYGCKDRIAYFDPQDKRNIEYVFYLYNNPCNKDGVLGIIEPFEGDKETRVFFLSQEKIQSKQENVKDEENFWKNIGREYTNMSGKEFAKQKGTSIIRHTGTMADFSKKIGGILGIETIANKDSQYGNIQLIRKKLELIGKEECQKIVGSVSLNGFNRAQRAIGPILGSLGLQTEGIVYEQ